LNRLSTGSATRQSWIKRSKRPPGRKRYRRQRLEPFGVSNRPPVALAMLVCDYAFRTADGKNCLIGIFDRLFSAGFPASNPRLFFYAKLAEGDGEYDVRLQIVDVTENKVISNIPLPAKLSFVDPLMPTEVIIQVEALGLPHRGRFEFRLYCSDMYVGHATFYVEEIPVQGG
jgi:hypothetical protein